MERLKWAEYNLIRATEVIEQREDEHGTWDFSIVFRKVNRLKKLILSIRKEAQRLNREEESCDLHNSENCSEGALSADTNLGLIPLHSCIWYTCSPYEYLIEYLRQAVFELEQAKMVMEKLKGNHNQWSSAVILPIIDRLWEQKLELCSGVQRLERKRIKRRKKP